MATVVAERGGGAFLLIALNDETGQVYDVGEKLLYPPQSLAALANRGYWTDAARAYDADALIRTASALQPEDPPATTPLHRPAPAR